MESVGSITCTPDRTCLNCKGATVKNVLTLTQRIIKHFSQHALTTQCVSLPRTQYQSSAEYCHTPLHFQPVCHPHPMVVLMSRRAEVFPEVGGLTDQFQLSKPADLSCKIRNSEGEDPNQNQNHKTFINPRGTLFDVVVVICPSTHVMTKTTNVTTY